MYLYRLLDISYLCLFTCEEQYATTQQITLLGTDHHKVGSSKYYVVPHCACTVPPPHMYTTVHRCPLVVILMRTSEVQQYVHSLVTSQSRCMYCACEHIHVHTASRQCLVVVITAVRISVHVPYGVHEGVMYIARVPVVWSTVVLHHCTATGYQTSPLCLYTCQRMYTYYDIVYSGWTRSLC